MRKRIFFTIFIVVSMIVVSYCIISFWSYGDIKNNPIKFLQGRYEHKTVYLLEDIIENNFLENAVILEDGSIYTEDANSFIRIQEDYDIRSIVINVLDFDNPEGTSALALTTHIYYMDKRNEERSKILLTRIGDNIFNLNECIANECIISLSNIEKSSVLIQCVEVFNYKQGYLNVFWGLILCIAVCTLILSMSCRNVAVKQEENNSYYSLALKIRKYILEISICITIILVGIYVYYYFKLPHIIHPEVYGDFARYANEKPSLFLRNLIPKIFDCTMIEHGLYRSRVLAFLWQYIDTNLLILIDELIPWFGIKMPLTLMIVPASILIWGYVFKKIFKDVSCVYGILFGAVILFIPNIQTATYFFLRSAKILVPVLGIGVINYGLAHLEEDVTMKQYMQMSRKNIFCILLLFILCTFDEQIIAICVFLFAVSILPMIYRKKLQRLNINMIAVLIMYIVYDKLWGRWLFEYFTPVKLQRHVHNITMIITDFDFIFLQKSLEIYIKILRTTFVNDIILGVALGIFIGLWFFIDNWREKLVVILLLLLSYGLTLVMLIGLPILYYYDDMILSIYFISPILIFIYAIVYILSKSKILENIKHKTILTKRGIAILAFMLLLFVNIRNIEQCHLRHLGINGGSVQFRDELYDLQYFDKYYETTIVTRQQYDSYMGKE